MRARFSDLPLRGAVAVMAFLLLTGCASTEDNTADRSASAEPLRTAPSNAVATAPEFSADAVSIELEAALAEELGDTATTLAGESATAALSDSDSMIHDSGVTPEDCAPSAETQGLPSTGIALGITSRTLEDGSAESRSVRIVRFDDVAAVDDHLEGIRAEITQCPSLTVDQGEGLTADVQRTVEDLDDDAGLVVTTETALTMEEEPVGDDADAETDDAVDDDGESGTAATPFLELNPTTAVYTASGTDLIVYTGDADTDTSDALELIERLRDRLDP